MLVRISKDIFNKESYNDDLNNIFKNFRTGKHTLIIDDYDTIESLEKSKWLEELNSRDRKVVDAYIRASTKKDKSRLLITISETETNINFLPREADKYLDQPLEVLFENSEYDPPFFNAILKYFDIDGKVTKAKTEQWLRFSMGGGSSIGSVIKGDIANAFEDQCFTKNKNTYLRYFVILDSDKKYPSMEIDQSKIRVLDKYNINYHILWKREKENYLPFSVLSSLNDEYLKIYLNFKNPDQKDYFDIENGFHNHKRKTLSKEIQTLYSEDTVPNKNYEILKKGMTMDKYSKGQKYKAEFSKLFVHKLVTKDSMLEVINHQVKTNGFNEYEKIIDGIKKLL